MKMGKLKIIMRRLITNLFKKHKKIKKSRPGIKGNIITIDDLDTKYSGKYITFCGDCYGTEIVYVKNIHKSDNNNSFQVDGIMIDCCTSYTENGDGILIYEIEDFDFSKFYYFNNKKIETPEDLDKLLMSLDTVDRTHVISESDVVSEIFYAILCSLESVELDEFKNMCKIFKELAERYTKK